MSVWLSAFNGQSPSAWSLQLRSPVHIGLHQSVSSAVPVQYFRCGELEATLEVTTQRWRWKHKKFIRRAKAQYRIVGRKRSNGHICPYMCTRACYVRRKYGTTSIGRIGRRHRARPRQLSIATVKSQRYIGLNRLQSYSDRST